MELKFNFGKERVFEIIFALIILFAIIIASFGKVLLGGVIGILGILAVGIVYVFTEKD